MTVLHRARTYISACREQLLKQYFLRTSEPTVQVEEITQLSSRGRVVKRKIMRDSCICGQQVSSQEIESRTNVLLCPVQDCATRWVCHSSFRLGFGPDLLRQYHLACHNFAYAPKGWMCDSCMEEEKGRKGGKRQKR